MHVLSRQNLPQTPPDCSTFTYSPMDSGMCRLRSGLESAVAPKLLHLHDREEDLEVSCVIHPPHIKVDKFHASLYPVDPTESKETLPSSMTGHHKQRAYGEEAGPKSLSIPLRDDCVSASA